MRAFRLTLVALATVLLLLLVTAGVAAAAPSPSAHTYKVLVGAEQPGRGVDVMAYFPSHITIHVGDTVRWIQNSNEIHTVTFLGGQPLPEIIVPAASLNLPTTPSPLVFNPQAVARSAGPVSLGNDTTWANSGIMGREPGQYPSFGVTFTAAGTYHYVCVVHGTMMSGRVTVVGPTTGVPSPNRYMALAHYQIARKFAMAPALFRHAAKAVQPATRNPDGTRTHHILLGWSEGQIALMRFFPTQVRVRPGDTVQWTMTKHSDAPHTVTFPNGQPEPPLTDVVPQPSGPPVLYVDPGALFPTGTSPLTRTGLFNSGLMNPVPGTGWSMVVGNVTPGPWRYLCLLHDTSGMRGTLVVLRH
jgi:plastocyanin